VLLISGAQAPDHPALRRAQALAAYDEAGVAAARSILDAKLVGQVQVASEIDGRIHGINLITNAQASLAEASSFDQLLAAESQAALAYWDAWTTVPMPFGKRDGAEVPAHWLTFGQRHSPLS